MDKYLIETELVNFSHPSLQDLIEKRMWMDMETVDKVRSIYNFVRDEIKMGFSERDGIPASRVLEDGIGQCNTKSTLLMALLRATHIPCRIHAFTVDKKLFRGVLNGIWYRLAPREILHAWTDVLVNGKWYNLEGVILDMPYLNALQNQNLSGKTSFCGYGADTENLMNPPVEWDLNNTYIQHKGIVQDFGIYNSPDDLYKEHQQELNFFEAYIYKNIVCKKMTNNISKIRNGIS